MSLKHKPKITVTYNRNRQPTGSTSTTTTTATQSIFNDERFNNHHLINSSQNFDTTNNWSKPSDGIDLDNIKSNRLRDRKSFVKGLMSEGCDNGKTSLLGKRPLPRSSLSEDITESYSRLSVTDESDLPSPPKRRDTGSKGKTSVTKNQSSSLDVFDFPDDDDNHEPIRRFNNKTHPKTYDKSIRGLNKISTKNKDSDKSTQGLFKIQIQNDETARNFDDDMRITRGMIKSPHNKLGGDIVKVTHGIRKTHENKPSNIGSDIKVTHGKTLGNDTCETSMTPSNNLGNNISMETPSDYVRVTRGMNKMPVKNDTDIKKSNPLEIFDFPDSEDEFEKNITKKKSINSFVTSDYPKKSLKNLIDSPYIIGQNPVNTSYSSSSTRISRLLTTKTSKSTSSTNNFRSDSRKNGSSGDRKSVDDVFDFVKFIRGEAKTKRSVPIHDPATNIVNDLTNTLDNNIIRPATSTKKTLQTSSKSTTTSKEGPVNKPPKKPRKNNVLIDIPQAPSRQIMEVGTPVSFLSFQQKKKPSESSVWDAVNAVTSPTDVLLSPRKQNLVAKMSKPTTPIRQDKGQPSPYPSTSNYSTFSISKSKNQVVDDTKTKDDEVLSYADELLASPKSSLDFPSSAPPSYNISGGSGGQKTYGQRRTILGQDLDSMSFDPIIPPQSSIDMEIDDNDINDNLNLTPKKHALKSSHELREVGDNTRFADEMEYVLDGLENRSINVRRNSAMDLLSKLLDNDFLLKVRAHNYIPKIYAMLNKNPDSLIRCCFSFIICTLMEDKHSSESLVQERGFMEFIANLLSISSDPLSHDYDFLKKSEKSFIDDVKKVALKSTIFIELSKISLRSIALRTLSSLSSLRTRREIVLKNELRTSGGLLLVINILKSELELVNGLLSVIENGKPLGLHSTTLDFILIEQCLKILESATLFCSENQICIVEDKDLLHMLLELLLYCQLGAHEKNVKAASLALECLLGTLRVLINLTNENPSACQYVGSHLGMSILMRLATVGQLPSNESPINNTGSSTGNSESVDAVKFDVLLLSIGLLINLVETDSNNQDEFRRVDQNPTCPGSRMCMRACTCDSRESAVSCLVSLYNYQLQKDDDKTDSKIVAAYMAVLLGLLIKNNKDNQQLIIERLPDQSVNSLINLLQQFVHFNELVGEEATANGHASGQMLMSSSSLNNDQTQLENQRRTIGDSFLEIVDMLKSLES